MKVLHCLSKKKKEHDLSIGVNMKKKIIFFNKISFIKNHS